jgi:hypothetical protein
MTRVARRTLVSTALILILLVVTLLPTQQATAQLPWRDKSTPFGMVTAIGNRVRSDEIDTYVQLLREAGVQWTREEFFWHKIQTEPGGPYHWNGDGSGLYDYDRAVQAQAAAGINMLGLIDYAPIWYNGQQWLDDWIVEWGDFVYQVVARYGRGGPIKYWEIWNEPNLTVSGYALGLYTIADYARILDVARSAAKAADPEAIIVLGGLASVWNYPPSPTTYDYYDYLDELGRLGAWNNFDIIAIHPYRVDPPEGAPWRRDHQQNFHTELQRLDELMYRYGAKPIWLTEIGWATDRGPHGVTEDAQAQFLARTYLMAIAHPSVEKIFWYDFRNDTQPGAPYDQPVYNDREHEFHFGLLRRTYPLDPNAPNLRKPAYLAYRTMTSMLAGLNFQRVITNGDHDGMQGTYWYRFDGSRRVDVLWNTDSPHQVVQIACECREALVRHWNGRTRYLLIPQDGVISLQLDEQGSPVYIEYDPPVADNGQHFPATGHTLRGTFAHFWQVNGGLERFGYPLTEEIIEPDSVTGKPRVVQYFERARFEYFPEFAGTINEVQLGLLGVAILNRFGIDWQTLERVTEAPPECLYFEATGHSLCPPFRARWEQLGGLPLLGQPISQPFETFNPETGQPYTVQYFERARFEYHPEYAGTPSEVLLGLLGREILTRWEGP